MAKLRFKVGDRVKVANGSERVGEIGIIKKVYKNIFDYVVEFSTYEESEYANQNIDAHGCKGGYWIYKDDGWLEPAPAPKFKIDDRVKAIAACDKNDGFIGKYGTVIEVNYKSETGLEVFVEFDREPDPPFYHWWCEAASLVLAESETPAARTEAVEVKAQEVKMDDLKAVPSGYNYVARDMDGELFAYVDEPIVDIGRRQWYGKQFKKIDNNLFRELTWACAPLKVSRK